MVLAVGRMPLSKYVIILCQNHSADGTSSEADRLRDNRGHALQYIWQTWGTQSNEDLKMMFYFFICAMKHYRRLDILCFSVEGHIDWLIDVCFIERYSNRHKCDITGTSIHWRCPLQVDPPQSGSFNNYYQDEYFQSHLVLYLYYSLCWYRERTRTGAAGGHLTDK